MAILAAVVFAVAGCRDGGDSGTATATATATPTEAPGTSEPQSLREQLTGYFTALEAIFQEADARTNELDSQFDAAIEGAETTEEQVAIFREFLIQLIDLIRDASERMDELDPPAPLLDDHEAFLEATRDAIDVTQQLLEDLETLKSEEDADQLFRRFQTESEQITQAADDACMNLQTIADGNNIRVDLGCGQ
jgi:hypothetical protein